jgi:polyisoprenyl-phosphate glycosyltransferase
MKSFECKKILVLTPVYNDWESFGRLVEDIDQLVTNDISISILVVNDKSSDALNNVFNCKNILSIEIINLTANLGHQRAIAVGLSAIDTKLYDAIIVMDSDGEDQVIDIKRLVNSFEETGDVIVSRRKDRSESLMFKIFYLFYKVLFKLLTGKSINFGNYSIFSSSVISQLTSSQTIWNNFPATLLSLKLPITSIDTKRGKRYHGKSKMNLVSLILHGLCAISVFLEVVLIRLILGCLSLLIILSIFFILLNRYIPILELNMNFVFVFCVVLIPLIIFLFVILLVYLNSRSKITKKISSVYVDFISSKDTIYKKNKK